MPIHRRQLLQRAIGAMLASSAGRFLPADDASSRSGRMIVIVRTADGLVGIDPRTGIVRAWDGPIPAIIAERIASPAPGPVPAGLAAGGGPVTWWMAAPDGDAFVFRAGAGDDATWWWQQAGAKPARLDLPAELEPAFAPGAIARWFHGATIDAAHLGSGTLRLLAVDLISGVIVLDAELDRRLELAATTVAGGGEVVAHVQAGNTDVAIWAADLRRGDPPLATAIAFDPAPVAASAIALRVAVDGAWMIVAAAVEWAWPDHPHPMVIVTARRDSQPVVVNVEGELVGIARANR